MLVIKYEKIGSSKYIPHVDMLRQMARILRRAEIKVAYSQGFNPHELIFFASPNPTGLSSVAEYCTIFTDESESSFIDKFNKKSIDGIKVILAKTVDKNPNFAGISVAAKYKIDVNENTFSKIEEAFLLAKKTGEYNLTYSVKGESVTKNVAPLMIETKKENDGYYIILSYGNTSLRADRLLSVFNIPITKIQKTDVFYNENNLLESFDEFFC